MTCLPGYNRDWQMSLLASCGSGPMDTYRSVAVLHSMSCCNQLCMILFLASRSYALIARQVILNQILIYRWCLQSDCSDTRLPYTRTTDQSLINY